MGMDVGSGVNDQGHEDRSHPDLEGTVEDATAAARLRVVSYLASFGDEPDHVAALAGALTARAALRHPERDLGETALEEAESGLAAWSFFVLGRERIGDHPPVLVAQAAYRGCGGGARWPRVLLSYDLPDGFVEAMRTAAPPVTPPERRGRMMAQPLETWSPVDLPAPRLWHRLVSAIAGTSRV